MISLLGSCAYAQDLPAGVSRPQIASTDLVYPGCPLPPTTFGHVWYFDPVHGKTQAAGADGSQANPYNSLAAVFNPTAGYSAPLAALMPNNPAPTVHGPIQPGDELLLNPGNYGDIGMGGLSTNQFVGISLNLTIAPIPGAASPPVLATFGDLGISGIYVHGPITVQSHNNSANASNNGSLIWVENDTVPPPGSPTQTVSNVEFDHMLVQTDTPANIDGLTQGQLGTILRAGVEFLSNDGGADFTCAGITNSHITQVAYGQQLFAGSVLSQNNTIDHFFDDGIDYGGSNIAMINNTLVNAQTTANGIHTDGIQAQEPLGIPPNGAPTWPEKNIYIARNFVAQNLDPSLPYQQYLQGIDMWDGDWTNVIYEDNRVAVSSCYSYEMGSAHNAVILNNSAIDTGILADEPGCIPSIIIAATTHESPLTSSNILIRNNVAPGFLFSGFDGASNADHNVATGLRAPIYVTFPSTNPSGIFEGNVVGSVTPAAAGVGNVKDGTGTGNGTEFTSTVAPYDFTLLPNAPARTVGTSVFAPKLDTNGLAFVGPSAIAAGSISALTPPPPTLVTLTGGVHTIDSAGNIVVTFPTSGTLTASGSATVQALLVGAGGGSTGAGGGGGQVLTPAITLPAGATPVTIGAGGLAGPINATGVAGTNGGNTSIGSLAVALGGGSGGASSSNNTSGGGNGGGAGPNVIAGVTFTGGVGAQNNGGASPTEPSPYPGAGGAGAGSPGAAPAGFRSSGNGGNGLQSAITGTNTFYGGGGSGGFINRDANSYGTPGLGGGGQGGITPAPGAPNTGGGAGGGTDHNLSGAAGGTGFVAVSCAPTVCAP